VPLFYIIAIRREFNAVSSLVTIFPVTILVKDDLVAAIFASLFSA
jgi:hypothetical protein